MADKLKRPSASDEAELNHGEDAKLTLTSQLGHLDGQVRHDSTEISPTTTRGQSVDAGNCLQLPAVQTEQKPITAQLAIGTVSEATFNIQSKSSVGQTMKAQRELTSDSEPTERSKASLHA